MAAKTVQSQQSGWRSKVNLEKELEDASLGYYSWHKAPLLS